MFLDGRSEAAVRERDERMVQAWHIAALMRCETLPDIATLLVRPPPAEPQTEAQQMAIFNAMIAAQKRQGV